MAVLTAMRFQSASTCSDLTERFNLFQNVFGFSQELIAFGAVDL